MKKILAFSFFALCLVAVAFAQSDSTVTVVLPSKLDFSTLISFKETTSLLISAALTIVSGFWAKGNVFLKQYLPTTEKRVAFVGLLVSLGAGLAFGFSGGILTTIWTSVIGVLTGMGGFGVVKPKTATA